jgi:hypothetical protein
MWRICHVIQIFSVIVRNRYKRKALPFSVVMLIIIIITLIILSRLKVCVIIDGVCISEWIYRPLVYTTRYYPLQTNDTQRLVSSSTTVSISRFLATASIEGDSSASPRSGPLVTAARGWRPFDANPLVFSSQADFKLNSLSTEISHSPISYFN